MDSVLRAKQIRRPFAQAKGRLICFALLVADAESECNTPDAAVERG